MAYILSGPENLQFLDRISAGSCLDGLVFGAARAALATPALIAERIHAINQARRMIKQTLPQVGYEFRLPPGDFLLLLVADIDAAAQYLSNQSIPFCRLPGFDTPRGHLKVYLESPQQAERLLMALSARAGELATGYNRNRSGAENRLKTLDTNMAKVG
jgi:histidinol-phosphate/aromatic aminotransferase/cobyric acid decarboxylase-like protein